MKKQFSALGLLLFLGLFSFQTEAQDAFITEWITTDTKITIPTNSSSGTYNYDITWTNLTNTGVGDGSAINRIGNYTITDLTNGDTYRVSITGDFPHFHMNSNSVEKDKIRNISQWGNIVWESMEDAFHGCSNLNSTATDAPNLSNVTNMASMFEDSESFIGDVLGWNTQNVTDMSDMFEDATYFNGDISMWNTENVTDMSDMFYDASSFNGDISGWNTKNVEDMEYMFGSTESFNRDISSWNTESVTSMYAMFFAAEVFNQDLTNWNTQNVEDMSYMFQYAYKFNGDLSNWNTGKVTDMTEMFYEAYKFNGNVSDWNTENVTTMSEMFEYAYDFNRDLSKWNTRSVTDMYGMFYDATSFNQDISGWDTHNVKDMQYLFEYASSFNQNLGNWDISNATDVRDMLGYTAMSTTNYDATLKGWATLDASAGETAIPLGLALDAENLTFCNSETERTFLIDTKGWTINGDSKVCQTIWNGVAWIPSAPSMGTDAEIAGDYSGTSFSAGNLTVNTGRTLTVSTGEAVEIDGDFINNGTITVENNGAFIQTKANPSNSGAGIYTLNRVGDNHIHTYNYWSTPVHQCEHQRCVRHEWQRLLFPREQCVGRQRPKCHADHWRGLYRYGYEFDSHHNYPNLYQYRRLQFGRHYLPSYLCDLRQSRR